MADKASTYLTVEWQEEESSDHEADMHEDVHELLPAVKKYFVIDSNSNVQQDMSQPFQGPYFKVSEWEAGEYKVTGIHLIVKLSVRNGLPILILHSRGVEVLSVTVHYDARNCMPTHGGVCQVSFHCIARGSGSPGFQVTECIEAYHNRVAQLLWEWLLHVKRNAHLTFDLRRVNFDEAIRTQPIGGQSLLTPNDDGPVYRHEDPWHRVLPCPGALRQREEGSRVARRHNSSYVPAWCTQYACNCYSL
jgi:hypothetical protein